jgi:hypothetical protein
VTEKSPPADSNGLVAEIVDALVSLILGALFYLVVTPLAMAMRLFGYDPLRLRNDRSLPSYWIDRQPPGPAPPSMERQF